MPIYRICWEIDTEERRVDFPIYKYFLDGGGGCMGHLESDIIYARSNEVNNNYAHLYNCTVYNTILNFFEKMKAPDPGTGELQDIL
jgi:hypothetical protein